MVGASNLFCEIRMGGQSPPYVVVQARSRSLQRNGGGRSTLRVSYIETWYPASVQTAAVQTAGGQTSQCDRRDQFRQARLASIGATSSLYLEISACKERSRRSGPVKLSLFESTVLDKLGKRR